MVRLNMIIVILLYSTCWLKSQKEKWILDTDRELDKVLFKYTFFHLFLLSLLVWAIGIRIKETEIHTADVSITFIILASSCDFLSCCPTLYWVINAAKKQKNREIPLAEALKHQLEVQKRLQEQLEVYLCWAVFPWSFWSIPHHPLLNYNKFWQVMHVIRSA